MPPFESCGRGDHIRVTAFPATAERRQISGRLPSSIDVFVLTSAEYLVPAGSKLHIEDSVSTQTPSPAGNVVDNENSVLRCQKLPCVAAQAAHIADRLINTRAVQRPSPGPAKLHTMPTRIVASSKLLPISAKILQPVLMFRLPQRSEYPW